MKKIQNKFRVLFNALLTTIMGAFGFSSCIAPPVLYGPGVPEDIVEVDGQVTNEQGEPLQSIQVVINTSRITMKDTVYTNAEGEFERTYGFPQEGNDTLHVILNDTSDIYASDTVHMAFADMEKERESEWDTHYSADIDVQLKKNEQ